MLFEAAGMGATVIETLVVKIFTDGITDYVDTTVHSRRSGS